MYKLSLFTITLFMLLGLTSCLTYKEIVNFQDGDDLKDGKEDSILNNVVLRVQPGDVLNINISSYNSEEANKFNLIDANQAMRSSNSGGAGVPTDPFGYRVDSKGLIDMPVIGNIYVKDLSIEEIRDLVSEKITETGYLKESSVQVMFLTFKVTILGEVGRPGTYTITNNKVTILEAIGLASDLTIFSKRDDIMIVREKEGKRIYGRVDFKTKEVFESPYYYLVPNDIVYVNPHKSKILSTQDPITRYLGTVIGLATLIVLIANL